MRKPNLPRTALAFVTILLLAAAAPVSGGVLPPLTSSTSGVTWHPSNETEPGASPAAIHFVLHDSPRSAPAGGMVSFRYTLVNLGSAPVTVLVTADEPLGQLRVAATPYLHVLEPLRGAEGRVTVDASTALAGTYAIPVRASVQEDSRASVTRFAVLMLTPGPAPATLHGVHVDLTPDEQQVPPGGFALLKVHVANTGLLPATVDVRILETTGRLKVSPSTWSVLLAPGERATQVVWVNTSSTDEGKYNLRAKATVRGDPASSASDDAVLHVMPLGGPRYGFRLELSPSSQVAYAGETAWYEVRLTSVATADQTVALSAYEPTSTLRVGLGASEVHLPAGGSVSVRLFAETDNRTSGDYSLIVQGHAQEDPTTRTRVEGRLTVLRMEPTPTYGVALSMSPRNQTVEAGRLAVFDLKVMNTGNATATVDLAANATTSGLFVWLSKTTARLSPGEGVLLHVYANTTAASAGTYRIVTHASVREAPGVAAADHATLTVTRAEI